MIKINGEEIDINHFPDGTQLLKYDPFKYVEYNISWHYEDDSELLTLIYLVNHIRSNDSRCKIKLNMPYIPNARMDRTKNIEEVFTLKYFVDVINSLNFDKVYVLDPHSDVSVALLNNVKVLSPNSYIEKVLISICDKYQITKNDLVVYFPDAGAYKRYKDIPCLELFEKIYGEKVRDWSTGKIMGLDIVDKDRKILDKPLTNKIILMVDDIISYGGTMYHSAKKINEFNPKTIFAYATHVEPKSFWDEYKGTFRIAFGFDGRAHYPIKQIVEKLYTTNSIYNFDENDFVIPMPINYEL